ncbi:MAG: class I SAM-dependent methyltransferase [Piscinibacter sp.]|nr:class I SAM-dependent methyltransferase [Piscinibacter sp.]
MSAAPPPAEPFLDAVDKWNRRFAGDDFAFGTAPNDWLRERAGALPPGGRVLCVADGEGRNSVWLAGQGHTVDAFDISPVGVAKARRFAQQRGADVRYAVADGDALAWPAGLYDGVVAIFIQYATPAQRARLFAAMRRSLRPGGVLMLLGYTPRQIVLRTGGPGIDTHLYTEALLRKAFAGMAIERLDEFETVLAEGSSHVGPSALIGLVARQP